MIKQRIENVIASQQIEKAREHVRANKNVYIAASIGILVGRVTAPKGVDVQIVNTGLVSSRELQGL